MPIVGLVRVPLSAAAGTSLSRDRAGLAAGSTEPSQKGAQDDNGVPQTKAKSSLKRTPRRKHQERTADMIAAEQCQTIAT